MNGMKGQKTGGRVKGVLNKATVEREKGLDVIKELVLKELGPMTEAQIAQAKGVKYMILRQPNGSYARATDVKQIDVACAIGAEAFEVFTAAPDTQAFRTLTEQSFGRPVQRTELTGKEGGPVEIAAVLEFLDLPKKRHRQAE